MKLTNNITKNSEANSKKSIYAQYCSKNEQILPRLIIEFLKNEKEGRKYYQPNTENGKITGQSNIQLIDFDYIANLLRLFMHFNDEFSASFEYNDKGKLEYVIQLIDKIKRDEHNRAIKMNNHLVGNTGTHIFRYGTVNSPKDKYNNKEFDRYFRPKYNSENKNNRIPKYWFPKNDENNIHMLAQLIESAFNKFNDRHSKALFIAFLKLTNSGKINGFNMIQNHRAELLLNYCEKQINSEMSEFYNKNGFAYGYTKPLKKYRTNDEVHYYDDDGNPSDDDMEYQTRNLNIESIIRKTIRKFLSENLI